MAATQKRKTKPKAKPKPKPKGARKSTLKRKNAKASEMLWMRRAVISVCAVFMLVWCVAWFFASDADSRASAWVKDKALQTTEAAGFRVQSILVDGREYSDGEALLALLNVGKGDPVFALDPAEAKEQIEKITWVKAARVERRLPDMVYIDLTEREPMALYKTDDDLVLIDREGVELTRAGLKRFEALPMIRGQGAPQKAPDLFTLIDVHPQLKSLMDHAVLVDDRRWDIYLKGGARLKLPEDKVAGALTHVMERHAQDNILAQDNITDIDARYQGRLIVRTKLGKVKDYKAGYTEAGMQL